MTKRAERDAFGRVVTDSELTSIDDLLTDAERAELTADLTEMHDRTHPCWADHFCRWCPHDTYGQGMA